MSSYEQGLRGEEMAAWYLENKGWRILEKRYRTRMGEIDLIAEDPETDPPALVFAEVKYRKDSSYGRPSEFVDVRKQKRILLAARHYLMEKRLPDAAVRMDVIAIWLEGDHHRIHHYKNAFGEDLWTS